MKVLPKIFYIVGFTLEYVIPLLLFGFVTPLVHGKLDEGFTTVGLIAVGIFGFICLGKIKEIVKQWKKGIGRAVILALIKAVPLIVLAIFTNWLSTFIISFTTYLNRVIPLFIAGCTFDMTAEYLESKE